MTAARASSGGSSIESGLGASIPVNGVAFLQPVEAESLDQALADLEVVVRQRPIERGARIVVFGLQTVSGSEVRPTRAFPERDREFGDVLRVASPDLWFVARSLKALARVLADRLEHEVAVPRTVKEALVEQGRHGFMTCVAHRLRGIQSAASREHAQASEDALLLLTEQVVTPVDRRSERLLALREVAGPPDEDG